MSNRPKIKRKRQQQPRGSIRVEQIPRRENLDKDLTPEQLENIKKHRPKHPDFDTMSAAVRFNDAQIGDEHQNVEKVVQQYCDSESLIYVATQRAMRNGVMDQEEVKLAAAAYIDGFITACVCQDRAVIDMNPDNYEEYERDETERQARFEQFRRQSSDVFTFTVDRKQNDDRSFSKGAMEWLHDTLWLFLAARISAHWDREGKPCKGMTVHLQVNTDA